MKRTAIRLTLIAAVLLLTALFRYGSATATDTPQAPTLPACTGTTQPPQTSATTDASGILVTVSIPERPGLNCQ